MKRIPKDGAILVLLRHTRPSGEAAETDSIPASAPGPDHDPREAPCKPKTETLPTYVRDDSRR